MSQENVEIMQKAITAFNRRDAEGFGALFVEAAEIVPVRSALEGTVYRGPDAGAQYCAAVEESWENLAWEVEALVEAGLKPAEALTSATIRGGELLGEAEAGRIVEGGPADFFLVHGDPLSDASALWRVWKVAWLP